MDEDFLRFQDDYIYLRYNSITDDKPALLMLHGLGDSGLTFEDVFDDPGLGMFNILVPDLIGYGRSSKSAQGDYSFESQVRRLWDLLDRVRARRVFVVGHSLGGDLATLLCASDRHGRIERFVNVEGDVTQYDLFISSKAVEAAAAGRFEEWLRTFRDSTVYRDWGSKYESCRRYYASLWLSRAEAFIANARECYERNTALSGRYRSEIGKVYCALSIPRVFCYGTESLSGETAGFLIEKQLEHRSFDGAFHWVMIDDRERFYPFLHDFLTGD